jgi:hypothetical protein
MTSAIKNLIASSGLLVCPSCNGEGEIGYFCGHESSTNCYLCDGNGIIRSLKKQKQSKKCDICEGEDGGCGGCNSNPKGLIEWESYELL